MSEELSIVNEKFLKTVKTEVSEVLVSKEELLGQRQLLETQAVDMQSQIDILNSKLGLFQEEIK